MTSRSRRLALLAGLAMLAGCYTYAPTAGPVPVGSEVRARLTQETALAESELLGMVTQDYQGRLTGMTEDSIMISVVAARAIGTATTRSIRRTVRLPLTGVQQISQRSLSVGKTAVATGAAAALMVVAVRALGSGGGGEGDPPVGDPTFRPGFRLSWPF